MSLLALVAAALALATQTVDATPVHLDSQDIGPLARALDRSDVTVESETKRRGLRSSE